MMSEENYSLEFSFPDASASFTNGFEAGMVYERLNSGSLETIDLGYETGIPVHDENVELIEKMGSLYGFTCETKCTAVPGWTAVRLVHKPNINPNGPKLKLVK